MFLPPNLYEYLGETRGIVDASMMTEKEREEIREEFGPAIPMDTRNRYLERIIIPILVSSNHT